MSYQSQLLNKEWKAKRLEILERDNNECQICLSTERLHIHHKKYIHGYKAWEYENKYLITLCHKCHLTHELVKNPNLLKESKTDDLESQYLDILEDLHFGLGQEYRPNKSAFIKVFISNIETVENLDVNAIRLIFSVIKRLKQNKTLIRLSSDEFKTSRQAFYKGIKALKDASILKHGEYPCTYIVNKEFFFNGFQE